MLSTSAAVMPRVGSMRMSSGASWAYAKPRSASSSCSDETPRSKRMPWMRGTPSRDSTAGSSSYTACTGVKRSPNGARRRPARASASGSRSRPISRASGKRVSRASLWPPMPRVASTTTAPGRSASAGASRLTQRSRRTGTCAWPPWSGAPAAPSVPEAPAPEAPEGDEVPPRAAEGLAVAFISTLSVVLPRSGRRARVAAGPGGARSECRGARLPRMGHGAGDVRTVRAARSPPARLGK